LRISYGLAAVLIRTIKTKLGSKECMTRDQISNLEKEKEGHRAGVAGQWI